MEFNVKMFSELSVDELYEIIKSRTEIFLLEQNIICQDLDDVDRQCLHCFFSEGIKVSAYLRAFLSGEKTATIGRVLTLSHGKGLGTKLMKKSIEEIKKRWDINKISVHAQKQAMKFYEKMGFIPVSDEYLEEGVLHITMELDV